MPSTSLDSSSVILDVGNTSTYKKLVAEIEELKEEIQTIKDKIYRYYKLKRKTEALFKDSDDETLKSDIANSPNLEILLYNKIMQLKYNENESQITVLFPFNGESRFGFNLIQNEKDRSKTDRGKWNFEKSLLPHSVNFDSFKTEINQLTLQQIPKFMEQIQQNIYAYYFREDLVKQLKEILDSRNILLYHCLRYTKLELMFKVFNTETKIRRSLTIQLNFDLLSVRPNEVTCKINGGEDDEETKNFFEEHFKLFKETYLVTAYKEAFKNVDKYKFFV